MRRDLAEEADEVGACPRPTVFVYAGMVKLCFLCAALLSALLAIGCAGEAEITPEPALKGDYLTGTLRFLEDSPFGSVQAPAIANLLEADDVEIFTSSPIASTLAHSEEGYVLLTNGTVMTVGVDRQQLPTGLHVTIRNGDQPIAIAELAYAMFPELGDSVIVPEAGDYEGELLIITNGRAVGLGSVTATVDPDHDWTAIASGGGDWLGHGFFTGAFRPDGTFPDPSREHRPGSRPPRCGRRSRRRGGAP